MQWFSPATSLVCFIFVAECFLSSHQTVAMLKSTSVRCDDKTSLPPLQSKAYDNKARVTFGSCVQDTMQSSICRDLAMSGSTRAIATDYGPEYVGLNFQLASRRQLPGGLGSRFEQKFDKTFTLENERAKMIEFLTAQATGKVQPSATIKDSSLMALIVSTLKKDFKSVLATHNRVYEPLVVVVPNTATDFPLSMTQSTFHPTPLGDQLTAYPTIGSLCGGDGQSSQWGDQKYPIHAVFGLHGVTNVHASLKKTLQEQTSSSITGVPMPVALRLNFQKDGFSMIDATYLQRVDTKIDSLLQNLQLSISGKESDIDTVTGCVRIICYTPPFDSQTTDLTA